MIRGVYLAYPIDQQGPSSLVQLFQQINRLKIRVLEERLASWVFDPGEAFSVRTDATPDRGVAITNRAALNNSDLVLAFLPDGVPTVGVPMEIDRAYSQGKHVVVFSDRNQWMIDQPGIIKVDGWEDEQIDTVLGLIAEMEARDPARSYMELGVKILGEGGVLPTRAHADDAGLDLVCSREVVILPGEFRDVPFNIAVQMDHNSWGLITGRSSAFRKKGLHVTNGIIDTGYTGPLYAGVFNPSKSAVRIEKGERIAQLILMHNNSSRTDVIQVHELRPTARGSSGFGSSGA